MTDELMALLDKATAMNGETFAQTVDRIICEHSAWIGCPNKQIAEKIAFSALVRASAITERADSEEVTALIAEVERLRGEVVEARSELNRVLMWNRDTCEAPEIAAMRYIEMLRADEGDTVVICCDNPEAESVSVQTAIDCNGLWTDFKDWRFTGESVLQCLSKAVTARAALGASHDAW